MIILANYLAGIVDPLSLDAIHAWESACLDAKEQNKTLLLPAGTTILPTGIYCNKITGAGSGSTIFIPEAVLSQYGIKNAEYDSSGNLGVIGSHIEYTNFSVLSERTRPIGLANVESGVIDNVSLSSLGTIHTLDPILDFRAKCKNIMLTNSIISNMTGARGDGESFAAGGGGCVWVRNWIVANGDNEENHTRNIVIDNCDINHCTSDEAVAFFGVNGVIRNCELNNSLIISKRNSGNPNGEPTHKVLISFFPCSGSVSPHAAIHSCKMNNCKIVDHATVANVLRCGFSVAVDGDNFCYDIEIKDNEFEVNSPFSANSTFFSIFNIENKFPDEYENSRNIITKNTVENIGDTVPTIAYGGFLRENANLVKGAFMYHFGSPPYICSHYGEYINPKRIAVSGKLNFEY